MFSMKPLPQRHPNPAQTPEELRPQGERPYKYTIAKAPCQEQSPGKIFPGLRIRKLRDYFFGDGFLRTDHPKWPSACPSPKYSPWE